MRNENELVSRNQVTEHAVSHQKESELASDRDGVPTEGLFQWGSVTLSFLEGETTRSSLQDGCEREKMRPGEKLGDCCCSPVQDGGGSNYRGGIGMERSRRTRGRLTRKG